MRNRLDVRELSALSASLMLTKAQPRPFTEKQQRYIDEAEQLLMTEMARMKEDLDNFFELVGEWMREVAERLKPVVDQMAERLKPVVDQTAERLKPVVDQTAERLKPVVDQMAERLKPVVDQMAERLKPVVDQMAAATSIQSTRQRTPIGVSPYEPRGRRR